MVVELILAVSILALAYAILKGKVNFTITVEHKHPEANAPRETGEIKLDKNILRDFTQEEEAYYKESGGVLEFINQIMYSGLPDEEVNDEQRANRT